MTKRLTITILVLIVVALGAAVSGCLKKPVEPVNQNQNTNTNQAGEIDTSDWKTYRNEEYGFEFKYPEGFEIKFDDPIIDEKNNIPFRMSLIQDNKRFEISISPQLNRADLYKVSPGVHKKITIDSVEANVLTFSGGYWESELANPCVSISFINNNLVFQLGFRNIGEISDEIQGVLNSFKLY